MIFSPYRLTPEQITKLDDTIINLKSSVKNKQTSQKESQEVNLNAYNKTLSFFSNSVLQLNGLYNVISKK